jgi:hypothetical protein
MLRMSSAGRVWVVPMPGLTTECEQRRLRWNMESSESSSSSCSSFSSFTSFGGPDGKALYTQRLRRTPMSTGGRVGLLQLTPDVVRVEVGGPQALGPRSPAAASPRGLVQAAVKGVGAATPVVPHARCPKRVPSVRGASSPRPHEVRRIQLLRRLAERCPAGAGLRVEGCWSLVRQRDVAPLLRCCRLAFESAGRSGHDEHERSTIAAAGACRAEAS